MFKKGVYRSQVRGLGQKLETDTAGANPHLLKPEPHPELKAIGTAEKGKGKLRDPVEDQTDECQRWDELRERREKRWEEQQKERELYWESLGSSLLGAPEADTRPDEPKSSGSKSGSPSK